METKIKTHHDNYTDFVASEFFALMKAKEVRFTPRIVDYRGEKVVLVHLSGVMPDASVLDVDYWPRYSATADDIKALPVQFTDFVFRIGQRPVKETVEVVDPESGEVTVKQVETIKFSAPRFLRWKDADSVEHRFNGKRSRYDETERCSVWVEPDEDEKGE